MPPAFNLHSRIEGCMDNIVTCPSGMRRPHILLTFSTVLYPNDFTGVYKRVMPPTCGSQGRLACWQLGVGDWPPGWLGLGRGRSAWHLRNPACLHQTLLVAWQAACLRVARAEQQAAGGPGPAPVCPGPCPRCVVRGAPYQPEG